MTYVCRMPVCCQGYKTFVMPRLVSSWTWQVEVSWRCLRTWWTSPRLGRRCSIGVQENDTTCKRWKTCMTNIAKDIWWDWKRLVAVNNVNWHTPTHTHTRKKKLQRNELCTVWVLKWLDIFHSGDTIALFQFHVGSPALSRMSLRNFAVKRWTPSIATRCWHNLCRTTICESVFESKSSPLPVLLSIFGKKVWSVESSLRQIWTQTQTWT